jgi:hypothetical protein
LIFSGHMFVEEGGCARDETGIVRFDARHQELIPTSIR